MKKMNRVIAAFLAVLLTVQIMPFIAKAETETLISGDCEYTIHDDGTVWLSGYTGNNAEIVIPETINGFTVSAIGSSVFKDCTSLVSIEIPSSVISINTYAFSGCTNLASVELSEGLQEICMSAFMACDSLTSITIPSSVTSIEMSAFSGCDSLAEIVIPDSVESIAASVFYATAYLKDSDNWTDGVLYIGNWLIQADADVLSGKYEVKNGTVGIADSAFSGCNGITSIKIPSSVKYINRTPFFSCENLQEISVAKKNKYYTSSEGVLFSEDKTELLRYPAAKNTTEYQIPSGVKTIYDYAFEGASNLVKLEIPDSVISIGSHVLYQSACYENSANWIDGLFYMDDWLIEADYNEVVGVFAIKEGTVGIADYAFDICTDLSGVVFPSTLLIIGDSAFNWCTGLTTIEIPNNVTTIGEYSFVYCKNLSSITIPDSVTDIGSNAFSKCSDDLIIYGYTGTAAEEYATEFEICFEEL